MVFVLLSPAKTMKFEGARPKIKGATAHFEKRADAIAAVLKKKTAKELGKLMAISDKLADLNAARFKNFAKAETELAICAYQGDTYIGFDAKTLTDRQLQVAQNHIGILTGLYGVLQPLDAIKPYRLEMGTALAVGDSKNLYDYWNEEITARINQLVKKHKHKAVVGCASNEYLSAVDVKKLAAPFIQCDFKEKKNGKLVTVGLLAKRARGMMARYIVEKNITDPAALKKFNAGGYKFDKTLSADDNFVFVR